MYGFWCVQRLICGFIFWRLDILLVPAMLYSWSWLSSFTTQHSFAVPHNVYRPAAMEPSGKPVPTSDSLALPLRDQSVFYYEGIMAAILEALASRRRR